MGTFLIILVILFVAGPWIMRLLRPWLARMAARRMERYFRSAMGMPPPPGNSRKKKQPASGTGSSRRRRNPYAGNGERHIIPPEYAEDVDFTEYKDFSETKVSGQSGGQRSIHAESQVEDAEWEMIKETHK